MAGETAAAFRVERAALQSCGAPRLLRNVLLAGEPGREPNLHQPRPAPLDTVAGRSLSGAEPHARRAAAGSPRIGWRESFRPARSPRSATGSATQAVAHSGLRMAVVHDRTRETTDPVLACYSCRKFLPVS